MGSLSAATKRGLGPQGKATLAAVEVRTRRAALRRELMAKPYPDSLAAAVPYVIDTPRWLRTMPVDQLLLLCSGMGTNRVDEFFGPRGAFRLFTVRRNRTLGELSDHERVTLANAIIRWLKTFRGAKEKRERALSHVREALRAVGGRLIPDEAGVGGDEAGQRASTRSVSPADPGPDGARGDVGGVAPNLAGRAG